MASGVFNVAKKGFANGSEDWDTNVYKMMLLTAGYTFDPDHDFVDHFNTYELDVSGYVKGYGNSGRKTLTCSVVQDDVNNWIELDATDLTWTSLAAGATIVAAVVIRETGGSDATSIPIAYLDITDTPTNGGNFTLQFDADGILKFT